MTVKADPIKKAGADVIKQASVKAEKEMKLVSETIEMSVCGGLDCFPLSLPRKLAIAKFQETYSDSDEYEMLMVTCYILSLPKETFWLQAKNVKTLLAKAVAFADETDTERYELLMQAAASKIAHLSETSAMQSGGDKDEGNVHRSPG